VLPVIAGWGMVFAGIIVLILDTQGYKFMNAKLQSLPTEEIVSLLNLERKKFLRAIDYGTSGSDLEEIRDAIRELESMVSSRESKDQSRREASSDKGNTRSVR
jgi:hypothetical protein